MPTQFDVFTFSGHWKYEGRMCARSAHDRSRMNYFFREGADHCVCIPIYL